MNQESENSLRFAPDHFLISRYTNIKPRAQSPGFSFDGQIREVLIKMNGSLINAAELHSCIL